MLDTLETLDTEDFPDTCAFCDHDDPDAVLYTSPDRSTSVCSLCIDWLHELVHADRCSLARRAHKVH